MSFFRRITRYRDSPNRRQAEDRLTEVTAAVFEQDTRFVVLTLHHLLDETAESASAGGTGELLDRLHYMQTELAAASSGSPKVDIETQRHVPPGKFVDMTIRVDPDPRSDRSQSLRFWIESKHDADASPGQLASYEAALKGLNPDPMRGIVMVLCPRSNTPSPDRVPPSVPVVHWESVAKFTKSYARTGECVQPSKFLIEQYHKFLKGEGLVNPERLEVEHAASLRFSLEAEKAIMEIMRSVDERVQSRWTCFERRKRGIRNEEEKFGTGSYGKYRFQGQHADRWRNSSLEWALFGDRKRDEGPEPRHAYAFISGATLEEKGESHIAMPENAEWVEDLRSRGFERADGCFRFVRYMYPDELLTETSLDDQARKLGDWVIESFELLEERPPPA